MHKNIMEKWVRALRSGKYKHGRCQLNSGNAYCCLGVLCEMFIAEGGTLNVRCLHRREDEVTEYNGETAYPPDAVLRWASIRSVSGQASSAEHSVAAVNDTADSFTPSIEYIEQHWENM